MRNDDIILDDCSVKSVGLGKASTGNVQIAITFDVHGEADIKTVTSYRYFTDNALPYTKEDLKTLGWDPVANRWNIDEMINSGVLIGAKASLTCEYEDYEGKPRLKVKFINTPGGAGALKEKLSDDESRDFTSQLQRRMGVTGGTSSAKKAKPAPVGAGKAADDDPPF